MAGRALFAGSDFAIHAMLGSLLALPVLTLFLGALLVKRLRGFRWWAGILTVLTLVQFAPAAGDSSPLLAYHPLNGALLLIASLVLLAKIEHRRVRV
nr:DUF6220 domain-containing protein [Mesorhizobium liriopis]